MKGNRPYLPVIVLSGAEPRLPGNSREAGYAYAVPFDLAGAPPAKALVQSLIIGSSPFVLLLTPAAPDPLPDALILCLFSRSYLQINGAPVVAFTQAHSTLEASLNSYLRGQGYPGLHAWAVPEISTPGASQFLETAAFGEPLFFQDQAAEERFYQSCQELLKDNEGFSACISEYLTLKATHQKLQERYAVLEERLKNAETTVEVARHKFKDDYDNLYDFYRKEYDILPLWYKRFGQIVKVLAGKRSFRSLFDDNVKKYKD
jgi:regulator of replication initiation timing